MARTLENLITEANSVFPDSFILTQYQRGLLDGRSTEKFAQFIVSEIHELFDANSSDQENLSRIITNLDMAAVQLTTITNCFQKLHGAALS